MTRADVLQEHERQAPLERYAKQLGTVLSKVDRFRSARDQAASHAKILHHRAGHVRSVSAASFVSESLLAKVDALERKPLPDPVTLLCDRVDVSDTGASLVASAGASLMSPASGVRHTALVDAVNEIRSGVDNALAAAMQPAPPSVLATEDLSRVLSLEQQFQQLSATPWQMQTEHAK